MSTIFTGSGVALVTPFRDNGVAFEALGRLIDFQIENGTDAILVLGTTGEPSTMTHEEEQEVVRFAADRIARRVPLLVGSGSNDTAAAIRYSQNAEKNGADAVLVVTPYYNKTTQKGLVRHYTAIADNVGIPMILYNVPGRTGLNMLPETVAELAGHRRIQAVKEASGSMDQVITIASLTAGMDFDIYSGEDALNAPILAMGGKGVISVVSNVMPKTVAELCRAMLSGDTKRGAEMQIALTEMNKAMFMEVNPIPVKTALDLMGMNAGKLRLPLTEMEGANLEKLKAVLKKYQLIETRTGENRTERG